MFIGPWRGFLSLQACWTNKFPKVCSMWTFWSLIHHKHLFPLHPVINFAVRACSGITLPGFSFSILLCCLFLAYKAYMYKRNASKVHYCSVHLPVFSLSCDWWLPEQGKEVCRQAEWRTPIMLCACPGDDVTSACPSVSVLVRTGLLTRLRWYSTTVCVAEHWVCYRARRSLYVSLSKVTGHPARWPLSNFPLFHLLETFTSPVHRTVRVFLLECDGEQLCLLPV